MKRNFFGEPVAQPGDDLADVFCERHGAVDGSLTAFDLADDSAANMGWTCSIEDDAGNELQAHDFGSEAELREWLADNGAEIDTSRG